MTSFVNTSTIYHCPFAFIAAAWGQVGGSITWYWQNYASAAGVQVVIGMGNPNWDDDGRLQCFNGAKTWYNGWYSQYHATLDPTQVQVT